MGWQPSWEKPKLAAATSFRHPCSTDTMIIVVSCTVSPKESRDWEVDSNFFCNSAFPFSTMFLRAKMPSRMSSEAWFKTSCFAWWSAVCLEMNWKHATIWVAAISNFCMNESSFEEASWPDVVVSLTSLVSCFRWSMFDLLFLFLVHPKKVQQCLKLFSLRELGILLGHYDAAK